MRTATLLLLALIVGTGCQDPKSLSGTALWVRFHWTSELNVQRLEIETSPPLGDPLRLPLSPDAVVKSGDTLRILLPDTVAGTELVLEARGYANNTLVAQTRQTVTPKVNSEVDVDLSLESWPPLSPDGGQSDGGISDGGSDNPCELCDPRRADRCTDGVCQCGTAPACGEGQACVGGQCVCNSQSCTGCCSGAQCLAGTAMDLCGSAGSACQSCAQSLCIGGVCTNACNAQLCPDGCCSGTQCNPADLAHCGGSGRACVACDPAQADSCTQGECRCGNGPACGAGLRCDQGQCRCDGQSCAQGCCENNRCRPRSLDTCAAPGAACRACDGFRADRCAADGSCRCGQGAACPDGQRCQQGQCVCDATTCPEGCCQGSECHPRTAGTCGTGGSACTLCDPLRADRCSSAGQCLCGASAPCGEGQRCSGGICLCDATSCPNGCCADGICVPPSPLACGTRGAACVACDPVRSDNCAVNGCRCGASAPCAAGQRCAAGRCVCDASSCSGCCADNQCMPGNTLTQCGANGADCATCNARGSDTCRNGTCQCGGEPGCGPGERCRSGACQ